MAKGLQRDALEQTYGCQLGLAVAGNKVIATDGRSLQCTEGERARSGSVPVIRASEDVWLLVSGLQ